MTCARRLLADVTATTSGEHVVSLPIRPPVRHSATSAWTGLVVAEAATATGTYDDIATIAISPVDADPTRPALIGVTVIGATLQVGWYRVTLTDAEGGTAVLDPVATGQSSTPGAPSLETVAALMLAHVTDEDDNPIAVWDTESTPTAAQVQALIDTAVSEVATEIKIPIPTKNAAEATYVVALRTVCLLEPSRHPEAVLEGESQYSTTTAMYLARLAALKQACRDPDYPLVR